MKNFIGVFLVVTLVLSGSCSWKKSGPYKSKLGNVFARDMKDKDWVNVPAHIKKTNGSAEEIVQAYIYFAEHEPDPTARPQVSFDVGRDPLNFHRFYWNGVCSAVHPYRARCTKIQELNTSLPNKFIFPKTETEIMEATQYFQELGNKSLQNQLGSNFRLMGEELIPPEFDRSTGRWLDVCQPSHSRHESCHILMEKNAREKTNKCVAEGLVALKEEYQKSGGGFSITSLPILGPLTRALGVTGSDLAKAGFRAEVNKLTQSCLRRNWNYPKKYLRHLTIFH